jgi:hypothetical protein
MPNLLRRFGSKKSVLWMGIHRTNRDYQTGEKVENNQSKAFTAASTPSKLMV